MWAFPAAAAAVSAVFAATIFARWARRRRPYLVAWAVALVMFAVASGAAAAGMVLGWSPTWFRLYYFFGAIANVPVLALGTIYLLGPRRVGHLCSIVVGVGVVFAAGATFTADLHPGGFVAGAIPPGSEVVPESIRTLSRYYSFAGFFVVVGGALWSAWRLSRARSDDLRHLVGANVLIAGGTFVVAVASGFARYGRGAIFAIGLLIGVGMMFVGFMRTRPRGQPA